MPPVLPSKARALNGGPPGLVARNTLAGAAGYALSLAIGLALTPFLLSRLGDAGYGAYALLASLAGFASLLDLGLSPALGRAIAAAGEDDRNGQAALVGAGRRLGAILAVLAGAVFLAAGALLLARARMPAPTAVHARCALPFFALSACVPMAGAAYTALLTGRQRLHVLSGVGVMAVLLNAGLCVAMLLAGWGLPGVAGAGAVVAFLAVAARWRWSGARGLPPAGAGVPAGLLRASGWFLAASLAGRAIWYADPIVLSSFLPIEALAAYAAAFRLADGARLLGAQMVNALAPAYAAAWGRGESGELRRLFLNAIRAAAAMGAVLVAGVLLGGRAFLTLWIGPARAEAAGPALVALCVGASAGLLQGCAGGLMQAAGYERRVAAIACVEAAANLALTVLLVPYLGPLGAALGTAVPHTVFALAVYLPAAGRLCGVPPVALVARGLLPVVGAVGISLLLPPMLPAGPWARLVAALVISSAIAAAVGIAGTCRGARET